MDNKPVKVSDVFKNYKSEEHGNYQERLFSVTGTMVSLVSIEGDDEVYISKQSVARLMPHISFINLYKLDSAFRAQSKRIAVIAHSNRPRSQVVVAISRLSNFFDLADSITEEQKSNAIAMSKILETIQPFFSTEEEPIIAVDINCPINDIETDTKEDNNEPDEKESEYTQEEIAKDAINSKFVMLDKLSIDLSKSITNMAKYLVGNILEVHSELNDIKLMLSKLLEPSITQISPIDTSEVTTSNNTVEVFSNNDIQNNDSGIMYGAPCDRSIKSSETNSLSPSDTDKKDVGISLSTPIKEIGIGSYQQNNDPDYIRLINKIFTSTGGRGNYMYSGYELAKNLALKNSKDKDTKDAKDTNETPHHTVIRSVSYALGLLSSGDVKKTICIPGILVQREGATCGFQYYTLLGIQLIQKMLYELIVYAGNSENRDSCIYKSSGQLLLHINNKLINKFNSSLGYGVTVNKGIIINLETSGRVIRLLLKIGAIKEEDLSTASLSARTRADNFDLYNKESNVPYELFF